MSLSTLSIKTVMTIVMNLTIVLFGIIGYTYLGVREFPSIDPLKSPLELIIRGQLRYY
jgi:HAE1 family hydrophobic/amphiphilic exporter-1/multidrug efflux pump